MRKSPNKDGEQAVLSTLSSPLQDSNERDTRHLHAMLDAIAAGRYQNCKQALIDHCGPWLRRKFEMQAERFSPAERLALRHGLKHLEFDEAILAAETALVEETNARLEAICQSWRKPLAPPLP